MACKCAKCGKKACGCKAKMEAKVKKGLAAAFPKEK